MTIKNPKKVMIKISEICEITGEKHTFCESVQEEQGSKHFVSVEYSGSTYGGASPCTSEERIKDVIEHAKKSIIREGDIPFVNDERVKRTLSDWF